MNMKQCKTLLGIQFTSILRHFTAGSGNPSKKKKTTKAGMIGMAVLWICLGVFFIGFFGMMFYMLADIFHAMGLDWLYMTLAYLSTAMMMLIGTVFLAKAQIFEAKDNAILIPMPIPTPVILLSRMLSLYLMNLIWGGIVMFPALVCRFLFAPFSRIACLISVLLYLALGLFSLALSCLLGWLIAVISARIRNKTFVTVFVSLVFIGVYYYFCGVGMSNLMVLLTEQTELVAEILGAIAPLYHIGYAAVTGAPLSVLSILLFLLVPFAAVYFLLSRTFIGTVTASYGTKKTVKRKTAGIIRLHSPRTALLLRENAHLLSSATYLLNAGVGLVFLLVGAVAILWQRNPLSMTVSLLGWDLLPALLIGGACMMLSMSFFSTPSVSLEAKTLSILRSMPIRTYDILAAKWQLHIVWCAPPALVFSIVAAVFFLTAQPGIDTAALVAPGISPEDALAMLPDIRMTVPDYILGTAAILLLPQLYAIVTGGFGLLLGLRFPTLNWTNEAQVVKQGTAVALSMFGNMGLLAVCAAIVWFGRSLLPVSVLLLLLTFVFAGLVFVIRKLLFGYGCRAFEALNI